MDYYLGILAGGRSNRFGSNKAIFRIDGIALISRFLLEIPKLNPQPKEVLLVLHDHNQFPEIIDAIKQDMNLNQISKYAFSIKDNSKPFIPFSFIFDRDLNNKEDNRAAIIGFQTLFNYIKKGFVQILPCDTPFFDSKVINYILSLCLKFEWKSDAIVPKWKNGYI